jgi:hypothetical protein
LRSCFDDRIFLFLSLFFFRVQSWFIDVSSLSRFLFSSFYLNRLLPRSLNLSPFEQISGSVTVLFFPFLRQCVSGAVGNFLPVPLDLLLQWFSPRLISSQSFFQGFLLLLCYFEHLF